MKLKAMVLGVIAVMAVTASAQAQRRQPQARPLPAAAKHKAEIIGFGGYVWTVSQDVWYVDQQNQQQFGSIDIANSGYWGIQVDVNVRPGGQLALLYSRQDSEFTFRQGGRGAEQSLGDVGVEFWQIGGIGGLQQGNIMPFTMLTLGGVRYIPKGDIVSGDVWKFGMIFGLGAKIYVNEKIGLRLAGQMPFTWLSGGLGFGFGGGGASVGAWGTGIVQFNLSAGLIVMLGG